MRTSTETEIQKSTKQVTELKNTINEQKNTIKRLKSSLEMKQKKGSMIWKIGQNSTRAAKRKKNGKKKK